MSELGVIQRKFPLMIAKLITHAYELGYELTLGEGFNAEGVGHKKGSNHYIKLAQDLNIFKDGVYLQDGTGHKELHDYWDTLGGAKRIEKDLNHYSVEYLGNW